MWVRPFSSSDRTYLHTACLRLYPLAEFFFRDDNAAAHTQGGEARFVHQFVGAGDGNAQHLCHHFRVEEQRQLIVVCIDRSFHEMLLVSNSEKKNLRFGGLSVRLFADGVCVFRSAACRQTVAAVWRLSFL